MNIPYDSGGHKKDMNKYRENYAKIFGKKDKVEETPVKRSYEQLEKDFNEVLSALDDSLNGAILDAQRVLDKYSDAPSSNSNQIDMFGD